MKKLLFLLIPMFLLVGCSSTGDEQRAPLTERQRDSTLSKTELPGAKTVGRAMEIADSAEARRSRPLPESN